jgi:uncharacterized protein (TIGR00369 family)
MSSQFKPKDAGFKARVAQSFAEQTIMRTIGATLLEVMPGRVEIELPYDHGLTQQDGFIHAGISSTILDSACGYAAFSLMPAEARVLTIEFKINLLAPAAGERFRALGTVRKPGRNIFAAEGELYAEGDGDSALIATMSATLMALMPAAQQHEAG